MRFRAKDPATLTVPPPDPEVADAPKSLPSLEAVTSALTVAGPFAVPAIVAVLVTFAELMATAAPSVSGGARAAVAEPSAFAFASAAADDQTVRPADPSVRVAGRLALVLDFMRFTETAAAAEIVPLDELAGGVFGAVGAEFVTPFVVAALVPRVRWLLS